MVLLLGTLFYTYSYVRNLIIEENNQHLNSMTRLLRTRIAAEKTEFQRYAEIVSEDVRFKEYMFAVVDIGTDAKTLKALYEHQFGWLPVNRVLVLDRNNNIIIGDKNQDTSSIINARKEQPDHGSRYVYKDKGLELIAYAAVQYRGNFLGTIVVSYLLDTKWFSQQQRETNGDIFLVHEDKLLESSIKNLHTSDFNIVEDVIIANGEIFRSRDLKLAARDDNLPQLYFALQESLLFERLAQQRNVMSYVISLAFFLIFMLGYFIVLNFNQPLGQLVRITNEVASGRLPHLGKSTRKDEIAELTNHFADMLQALRDKQSEIEAVHAELEKTAITDSLTELYNRRQLTEVFPKLLGQAQRNEMKVFGIIIDLDKFKAVNDLHGHLCGDVCLQHFSTLLKENSRANDYLFRLGGEEFLVLTIAENENGAFNQAEKIRIAIEQSSIICDKNTLKFTISCGVSYAELSENATTSMRNMLTRADKALFQAKKSGRNQVQLLSADNNTEIQPSLFS
jgi:diguanylate cyclase (GGDEF)-like protein